MTDASALPGSLEVLRLKFLEQCAFLLEGQARSHALAAATAALTRGEHQTILGQLAALKTGRLKKNTLQAITTRCQALEQTLALLADERRRRWLKNGDYVKAMMREFQGMLGELSNTLVEKSLLERQSRVLESIILSYEKIAQWKTFVQEILADLHASFPFHLFLVAFCEERKLSLHFYFMDDYPERLRTELRGRFTVQFLEMLGLPPNSAVDAEEYLVGETHSPEASLDARSAASRKEGMRNAPPAVEEIQLVTVTLPPHLPHVTGILGVGYASARPLSSQEQEAVRSMLAVMMMVVGSSKVLSRTLSELEYYSTHDPLTGLYNRRHFNEVLEYELGRSERHRHPFCLLFLDCDDFKDINDSYGHLSG